MNFLFDFKTRWTEIPKEGEGYRLLCSNPVCSLSCANLKNGKISVTSIHGTERHSYEFTKLDMCFTFIKFLESLSEKEQNSFVHIVNRFLEGKAISIDKVDEKI